MAHTGFDPQVHGFAFNNAWHPDEREQRIVGAILFVAALLIGLRTPFIRRRVNRFMLWSLALGFVLAKLKLDSVVYGLCGGMTFAALDFYSLGWKIPGNFTDHHPDRTSVEGRILRDYIWQRTLTSLWANTAAFLKWMLILHFHSDGKMLLQLMTCKELSRLKTHLDEGAPWPIGLVGTTYSPLNNHQVLAIGYDEDATRGTTTVYVYDSSCPSCISTLEFDSRNFALVHETCFNSLRGPLRGFFCEAYNPATPPASLRTVQRQP